MNDCHGRSLGLRRRGGGATGDARRSEGEEEMGKRSGVRDVLRRILSVS